jgi:ACS family hexuronate transporter-like MFS transporter
MRWIIALLLFLATALNYADRLALAIVSVDIRSQFHLDERDYSHVLVLFFLAYAIMYAGSGYLVDRLGTKKGFALFILSWSISQMAHAFTMGKWSLGAFRFALGLSEPGNWPAAAKAVAEWFPPAQRALGIGIFNAGSSLGSALAPPVVAWITLNHGWRASFVVTGAAGLVWLAFWWMIYETPRDYAEAERKAAVPGKTDWKHIITRRACWTLIIARFFTDPVIYFVIFWLPEYLRKERSFDLAMVGRYSWVPYIFGGIAYVVGGWLSARLVRAGWPLLSARKFVMLLGAIFMPVALAAPFVPSAWMAIAATCFLTFGHGFWVSNLQALPTDLFRGSEVGTASGFTGMGGAIGGMLAQLGTATLVTKFSYAPVFVLAGLMHPLSAAIVYALLSPRALNKEAAGAIS